MILAGPIDGSFQPVEPPSDRHSERSEESPREALPTESEQDAGGAMCVAHSRTDTRCRRQGHPYEWEWVRMGDDLLNWQTPLTAAQ